MREFDCVVIGSGIAGLSLRSRQRRRDRVALVTEAHAGATPNTALGAGEVCACVVSEEDSFRTFTFATPLVAGAGLCNGEVVRAVVTEGPARVTS